MTKMDQYNKLFFQKFPPTWKEELEKRYDTEMTSGRITDNLAGRIRNLQELMEEKCKTEALSKDMQKFANNKPCCDPAMIDIPNKWGCSKTGCTPATRKSPVKRRKYKRYKKRFKSKRYKPNKRQYKKRKSSKKKDNNKRYTEGYDNQKNYKKKDDCPRGKKSCKCWLCKEEGHYANECPSRKQYNKTYREILNVYKLGYEPLESEPDDYDSVYESTTDEEIREFSDDPGSEWELM
ncbi:hypothetical protein E1A91_D07G006900v1 [Gossypium mustelinum]|uniref:CCHC-type domain-containing protein n=1 Tax=Gossypium mustelinum TaxID=34275 RepID=A0A5D2U480_GOSMU|nr:hypothetical protein E1A91_D07G006900v1 [Gossypium mustelinum]